MPAPPPAPLLALVLLAGSALAAPCLSVRHLEIPAAPSGEVQRVCISPGQTTVFSFDAQLAPGSLTLEEADTFTCVEPGPSTLKLIPSEKAPLGRESRVMVRFADSGAPVSATFVLVTHAAEAASLVEVHRRKRTAESYQQELRAKEEELRQLREENARLRAEEDPGGLTSLRASAAMDETGVATQDISNSVTRAPTNPLVMVLLWRFRAIGRVAFEVTLRNPQGAPMWRAEGAALTPEGQPGQGLKVLKVWQAEPIPPGEEGRVIVETESPGKNDREPYILKLWDAEGQRAVTLRHVTFW